ncbi:MAG: hypothetical protein LBG88_03205 [Christensenellaceae bacterium]|jgi:hypothetical protein|nr:hypothetical protein [Christensenellaceae bacterium]
MKRKDGLKIKGLNGFLRLGALLVGENRTNVQNYYTQELLARHMDEWIAEKNKHGMEYNYRDIAVATIVRLFYQRPELNRFIVKGNFYQRYFVDFGLVMHKNLRTGEKETVVKCRFTGKETIAEIKQKLDATITNAISGTNATDDIVDSFLGSLPNPLLRLFVWTLRLCDRWGMLSDKFMFEVSPFHSSAMFGDMKSVHLGPVWHHLYNFGNCGFFATMGKEQLKPVVDAKTGQTKSEKVIELGITEDERFIDGLTYSHVMKSFERIISNLSVLETAPEADDAKWPHAKTFKSKKAHDRFMRAFSKKQNKKFKKFAKN